MSAGPAPRWYRREPLNFPTAVVDTEFAMEHLERLSRKGLGELLVSEGLLTKEQLEEGEREQARTGEPLSVILVDSGYLTDRDLARILSDQLQLPFLDISKISVNSDLEKLLDRDVLVSLRVVPIDKLGKVVTLAVCDIPEMAFLRNIKKSTGLTPYLFVAALGDVNVRYADQLKAANGAGGAPAHTLDLEMVGESVGEIVWNPEPGDLEEGEWNEILDAGNESVLKEKDRD